MGTVNLRPVLSQAARTGSSAAPGNSSTGQLLGPRVALYGSSTMARHFDMPAGSRVNMSGRGPLTWAAAMLGRRMRVCGNFGVAGETNDLIAARVGPVLASRPDIVFVHAGPNDVFDADRSAATAFAHLEPALKAILDSGAHLGLWIPQKWQTTDAAFTTARLGQHWDYCDLLRRFAAVNRNVRVVEIAKAIQDEAGGNGNAILNYLEDTKHMSNLGCYQAAKLIVAEYGPLLRPVEMLPGEDVNYVTDAYMTATGGTAGAGVTGTVWQKFSIAQAAGTPTVTASIVPAPDGSGFAQRLQITATAANDRVNVQIPSSFLLPSVATGDKLVFQIKVQINSSSALRALPGYLSTNSGRTIGDLGRDTQSPGNDKALPNEKMVFTVEVPAYDVPAGTNVMDYFQSFLFNAAGNADVTIWAPRMFKRSPTRYDRVYP